MKFRALAGIAGLVLGLSISFVLVAESRTVPIETSWSFDLSDPAQMMSYAHFVVVGVVISDGDPSEDETIYEVRVTDRIKGHTPETLSVAQLGVHEDGITFEAEDQPLMSNGTEYVLFLTVPAERESDVLTVMAGPLSAQPVSDEIVDRLRGATDSARWPDSLLTAYEAVHADRVADWTATRSDFSTPTLDD